MSDYLALDITNADLENLDVFLKKLKEQNPELDIEISYDEDEIRRD